MKNSLRSTAITTIRPTAISISTGTWIWPRSLWLDQEYLGQYDREDCHADSAIALQPPFEQPVQREITYSVTEEEGTKDRTYLSINTVVGTDLDPVLYVAFQILEYTLINAPGAPLKQALIDAGIGQDILGRL